MSGNRNITKEVPRLDDLAFKAFLRARQEFNFETTPAYDEVIKKFQSKLDLENALEALKLAADGSEDEITLPNGSKTNAIASLLKLLEENPRLLLSRGSVKTAGGIEVNDVTVYEFSLGAGDPDLAKLIQPYFATITDEKGNVIDGESERQNQYARYKPYIDVLAKQVESKTPTYDLRSLFEVIKKSSAADIAEALNINDSNRMVTRNTPLRKAFAQFRNATKPKKSVKDGMHYEHYTTLMQAFALLDSEWTILSNNHTDYVKCRLVGGQILGWLQQSLPRIDRFGFARAFEDNKRTGQFKYDAENSFPDSSLGDSSFVGLGFDEMIFGGRADSPGCGGGCPWESHVEQKLQTCRTYATTSNPETERMHDCLKK